MYEKLLSPTKFGPWELTSRVVMPPLTRNRADSECVPNARAAEYYGQRGTAGLIICEATQISPDATGYPRTPGIWNAKQTAEWKKIVDAIHAGGAKAVLQFWHCGRISHQDNQPEGKQPMAPSAVKPTNPIWSDKANGLIDNPMPREMTEEDIRYVIDSYRKASENAKAAGFDGVELHGANGYLIDQFCSSNTNLRVDAWGGTREKRMRFMEEVLKAMMTVYPGAVGVRIAPYGTFNEINDDDPVAKYRAMLGVAQKSGVAYVHIIRPVVSGNIELEATPRDLEVILRPAKSTRAQFLGPRVTLLTVQKPNCRLAGSMPWRLAGPLSATPIWCAGFAKAFRCPSPTPIPGMFRVTWATSTIRRRHSPSPEGDPASVSTGFSAQSGKLRADDCSGGCGLPGLAGKGRWSYNIDRCVMH